MRHLGIAVLAAGLLMVGATAAQAQVTVVSEGAYAPAGVQQFLVRSQRLGREFVVVVTPPGNPIVPGMSGPGPGVKLPAAYALDGGYGVMGPMAQMLSMSGVILPSYVVSVSYPPGGGDRNLDLLFRPVTEAGATYGGGGAAFLGFLTEELKPFLEARFPLDPKQSVLIGHSFGGLFAANVLAEAPEAFSGYVIASASVWRDPGLPGRLAAAAPRAGGKRVLVAVGGREDERMQAGAGQIADALKVETRVFADANHLSYYPKLAEAGLAWTLPSSVAGRVPTSISVEAMDRVTGVYALSDGRRATILRRGGVLIAQLTGLPGETQLLAETPRRFFVPGGFDVVMTFDGAGEERAGGLTVDLGGSQMRGARVEP